MNPKPVLQVSQLWKRVDGPEGGLELLKGIDLSIYQGESVAVVGASGSGKSTLLGLLAGLDTPSGGRVEIDEISLFDLDEDGRAQLRGEKVGFVSQSFQLLSNLTALENVMLPLELVGRRDASFVAGCITGCLGSRSCRHLEYASVA